MFAYLEGSAVGVELEERTFVGLVISLKLNSGSVTMETNPSKKLNPSKRKPFMCSYYTGSFRLKLKMTTELQILL